jgi:hypothetical protein
MPGTNRLMSEEATVNIGALQQRVFGLEQAVNNISQQLTSISQQITSGAKPNWSVLVSTAGFCLLFAGAIGGLAYAPIRENQTDLKAALIDVTKVIGSQGEKFVSIRELDGRSGRTRQEIERLNTDLNAQDIAQRRAMEQGDANLQRQIDDQKKQFGDTFSLRDALLQMQRRIDQLEAARRSP